MNTLLLKRVKSATNCEINLPASKSMSNRALVLRQLSGDKITIGNLSDARDTKNLFALLQSDSEILNVDDAGTAMRFLCAACCALNRASVITGSERMQQRPIKPLVEALKHIGFNIQYTAKEGFPPVKVTPIADFNSLKNVVEIEGGISSQFISALVMMAPVLPKGLTIKLLPPVVSAPYIDMTLAMMNTAGLKVERKENHIKIDFQFFKKGHLEIEADWTSALYWFSFCALLPGASFILKQLQLNSFQGDAKVAGWMKLFGVDVAMQKDSLLISNTGFQIPDGVGLFFNFTNHPDAAQTIIVLCAAKNINATFTGLESLKIKETDRIAALQNELAKCGVQLLDIRNGNYKLKGFFSLPKEPVATYNDHRMAMAFAPLAALGNFEIESPWVVDKSYPTFWKEVVKLEALN